jgi:hypothetical protein
VDQMEKPQLSWQQAADQLLGWKEPEDDQLFSMPAQFHDGNNCSAWPGEESSHSGWEFLWWAEQETSNPVARFQQKEPLRLLKRGGKFKGMTKTSQNFNQKTPVAWKFCSPIQHFNSAQTKYHKRQACGALTPNTGHSKYLYNSRLVVKI